MAEKKSAKEIEAEKKAAKTARGIVVNNNKEHVQVSVFEDTIGVNVSFRDGHVFKKSPDVLLSLEDAETFHDLLGKAIAEFE